MQSATGCSGPWRVFATNRKPLREGGKARNYLKMPVSLLCLVIFLPEIGNPDLTRAFYWIFDKEVGPDFIEEWGHTA
jgi:hypothetical protein